MYAIVIDGEYKGKLEKEQVQKILRVTDSDAKIELASFQKGKGWIPVCLDGFLTQPLMASMAR